MGLWDRLLGQPSAAERHRQEEQQRQAEYDSYIRKENTEAQRLLDKARTEYPAVLMDASAAPSKQVDAAVEALWTADDPITRPTDEQVILARVATWQKMATKHLEVGERVLGLHHLPRDGRRGASHTVVTSRGFIVRTGADVYRLAPQSFKVSVEIGRVNVDAELGTYLDGICASSLSEMRRFTTALAVALELQAASLAEEEKAARVEVAATKKAARNRPAVWTPERGPRPTKKSAKSTTGVKPVQHEEPTKPVRMRPALRLMRSPRDAELVASEWMVYMGFDGAAATNLGPDGGIDVQADGAAAQVKFHGKPIGRPPLQQLRGAAQPGEALLFFSFTGYTPQGIAWANDVGMALFGFDLQGEPEPVNDAARKLLSVSD